MTNISADSIEVDLPAGKTWGFVVQITPDMPYLLFDNKKIALTSGMTLKADVITEKRRIISYFFAPIIDTMQNSLGER